MAGGGGDVVVPVSPRARQPRGGRRRYKAAACLPLDVIAEIAALSDAATLVRCAATCRGARRRIAEDPNLHARLRLSDTGRFLLPLLRGHLAGITTNEGGRGKTTVYLVDTTAADTTRLVEATFASAAAEAETLTDPLPVDSRGGLVLIRATATTGPPWQRHDQQLLVCCNPATGRRLALPPEPEPFPTVGYNPEQYVLLVGDGYDGEVGAGAGAAVGRPFQVLKAKLVLSNSNRRLMVQTFSSLHGAWSPFTEMPTPNITREVHLLGIAAKGPGRRRRRALAVPDRRRELRAHAPRDSGAGERNGSPGELPPSRGPREV
jgi:hypothetical protein